MMSMAAMNHQRQDGHHGRDCHQVQDGNHDDFFNLLSPFSAYLIS